MHKHYKTNITQNYPFHLVDSSPWPLLAFLGASFITFGGVMYMHLYNLFLIGLFAIIFTCFQVVEYLNAKFFISDSVYGSTFYLTTGFHGFHVFIGTCFLIVCLIRLYNHHFTREHHFGFEAAAWYWHFVDVVWLFLFVSIYWWGGN